ncbi:hypothetical protein BOW52_09310 [Solemya elarraichensis gill symbiont]|uniref:Uncharacterized protein n=1 Tax=Solemya elarraichensis gill symbiont TaxID=1918949 RepID=A0A1T2KZ33_9GAMM|nr:hypothetical protein BOW52_09310 [Solemya elarraichensis gill symbiont]
MYPIQRQLPDPKEVIIATSPAAVVIFAAPGRIRDVPLWVKVNASAKIKVRCMPAVSVPKPVIVVVPVTVITPSATEERSVVVAEAIVPVLNCFLRAAWIFWNWRSKFVPILSVPAGPLLEGVVDIELILDAACAISRLPTSAIYEDNRNIDSINNCRIHVEPVDNSV